MFNETLVKLLPSFFLRGWASTKMSPDWEFILAYSLVFLFSLSGSGLWFIYVVPKMLTFSETKFITGIIISLLIAAYIVTSFIATYRMWKSSK